MQGADINIKDKKGVGIYDYTAKIVPTYNVCACMHFASGRLTTIVLLFLVQHVT